MKSKKETISQTYRQTIIIPIAQLDIINRYLNAKSEDEFQGEENTISYTAKFPDGKEIDVKCCGCQDSASWTEAVLFTPSGHEIACTEPSYEFDGPWELEDEGTTYIVDVIPR